MIYATLDRSDYGYGAEMTYVLKVRALVSPTFVGDFFIPNARCHKMQNPAYYAQSKFPEAGMYTNDLNNAHMYESERRNDERRAAAESELLRGLGRKQKTVYPSPVAVVSILAILVAILRGI